MAKRIYKRGDIYWGDFRSLGGKQESLGVKTKRAAEHRYRVRELEICERRLPALTTGQVFTLGLRAKARRAKTKGRNVAQTLKTAKIHYAHLERILGEVDFNDPSVNLDSLGKDYFDQRMTETTPWGTPLKPITVQKEIGSLHTALREAKSLKLFEGDPAEVVPEALRTGDVYVPRDRWLTESEYRAIREKATAYRRPWLDFMVETGADIGECAKIKREHVDFSQTRGPHGAVNVPGSKSAARDRWVPLTPTSRAAIEARLRVAKDEHLFRPVWTSSNFKRSARKWCEATGVPMFRSKDLRRSFASRCCQLGVPEMVVAQMLGHTDSKLVRRVYGRLSPDTFKAAAERLAGASYVSQSNVVDINKARENAGTLPGPKAKKGK